MAGGLTRGGRIEAALGKQQVGAMAEFNEVFRQRTVSRVHEHVARVPAHKAHGKALDRMARTHEVDVDVANRKVPSRLDGMAGTAVARLADALQIRRACRRVKVQRVRCGTENPLDDAAVHEHAGIACMVGVPMRDDHMVKLFKRTDALQRRGDTGPAVKKNARLALLHEVPRAGLAHTAHTPCSTDDRQFHANSSSLLHELQVSPGTLRRLHIRDCDHPRDTRNAARPTQTHAQTEPQKPMQCASPPAACIHTNKIAGNMPYPRDAASSSCV